MNTRFLAARRLLVISLSLVIVATAAVWLRAEDSAAMPEGELVFNGKDFAGWKMRNPRRADVWSVVAHVHLDPSNKNRLVASGRGAGGPEGIMFRDGEGDSGGQVGCDIMTDKQFGDCEVHCEFMIPGKSNSGVYLMGRYEVQILSDFGLPDAKMGLHNTGAIYVTRPASSNALKPYGQWNTYDITFRAPRFDDSGKKIANAKFIKVVLNGKEIQSNVEAPKPTGGQVSQKESATGPLMLQGDHGPVAFRNIRVKALQLKD